MPKKRGKQKSHKKAQLLPEFPPSDVEALSHDEDSEPSLRNVMSMRGDISARLSVNEQKVDSLTSHRDV